MIDDLQVIEHFQDPDSCGWAIYVLFTAPSRRYNGPIQWGILDMLTGTENGIDMATDTGPRTVEEVIRDSFWLVDWYPDEQAARAALHEARSRVW